jgi:pimeloyl-ACP methyl ester carboxylesterase
VSAPAEHVIYVHGLWLSGAESLFLRRRLAQETGFATHTFSYPTVTSSMAEAAERLNAFVTKLGPKRLHLVGHSLGGLVIYRFLERYPEQAPGRVVFLGTPSVSSRAAVAAARNRWIATLVGRCVGEELLKEQQARRWQGVRELGIIAGTQRLGLGQFFAQFEEDCDGTVAVSETRMPGATDHITLPVSHMGMMLSARVARETAYFLQNGRFSFGPVKPI